MIQMQWKMQVFVSMYVNIKSLVLSPLSDGVSNSCFVIITTYTVSLLSDFNYMHIYHVLHWKLQSEYFIHLSGIKVSVKKHLYPTS